jgi:DNA-binding NtrC family response regulator
MTKLFGTWGYQVNHANILIVEKDLTLAKELQELLAEAGFNVRLATTVDAILDIIRNNKFDLIILDAHFPEISGVELFQDIQYSHPDCKTILCFNSYSVQIKKIIDDLRIAATVQKPFELDSLIEILQNYSNGPPAPAKLF